MYVIFVYFLVMLNKEISTCQISNKFAIVANGVFWRHANLNNGSLVDGFVCFEKVTVNFMMRVMFTATTVHGLE